MRIKDFENFNENKLNNTDFKDKFDRLFAEYAINEMPLYLSDTEREKCKDVYGGVDVGIVYHGGKINTLHDYELLTRIKNGETKTINMRFKSATPDKSTAKSFADYIKSYDTLTMLKQLSNAYERGSSGEFGSYIIKLKPKKENVIYSTFGDTKMKLTRTAETECILFGDIEVVSIEIYEVITKQNYLELITKSSIFDLYENSFLKEWLRHHKIDSSIYSDLILEKIINLNEKDLLEFLTNPVDFGTITFDDVKQNPNFESLMKRIKIRKGIPFIDNKEIKPFNFNDTSFVSFLKWNFLSDILSECERLDKDADAIDSKLKQIGFFLNESADKLIRLCRIYRLDIKKFEFYDKVKIFFDRLEEIASGNLIEMLDIFLDVSNVNDIFYYIDILMRIDSKRGKELIGKIFQNLNNSREINIISDNDKKNKYINYMARLYAMLSKRIK